MEKDRLEEQVRLDKVRKKVESIKGFYKHLIAYILVNLFLLTLHYIGLKEDENFFTFSAFSTAFFWGIGLAFHGLAVFGSDFFLGSNWEERKIKELMDREKNGRWE